MTDPNELEALKARLHELEAKQAPPAGGWAGALSLVGSVAALVPRWLVVAAGVVFVAWLGFDVYLNARQKLAETERIEAESRAAATTFKMPALAPPPVPSTAIVAPKLQQEKCEILKRRGLGFAC